MKVLSVFILYFDSVLKFRAKLGNILTPSIVKLNKNTIFARLKRFIPLNPQLLTKC